MKENNPGIHTQFDLTCREDCAVLRLTSPDRTNKLGIATIARLLQAVEQLAVEAERGRIQSLIITGNEKFFSAGADLNEISRLGAAEAFEFSRLGQRLMNSIAGFPVPAIAAIEGYCMGGGLDLALSCRNRVAAPDAVFGHRGASLGLITGWGGTQRLSRLVGRPRALQMFLLAEKLSAEEALKVGLVDRITNDPVLTAQLSMSSS